MSVRLKLFSAQAAILLVILTVGFGVSFLIFIPVAGEFCGRRLMDNLGAVAQRFFLAAGLAAIVLSALGMLWFWASSGKNVLAPLTRLKRAAVEIRDGNLDYELPVSGADEFYELGLTFEQMRVKLKNATIRQNELEQERSVMMAGICHDLKTPIGSILGYAEGIIDQVADSPEKVLEYARVIRKKALSLQRLSEDLSLLARLEADHQALSPQSTDMTGFLTECVREADADGIALELEPGVFCTIDPAKMERALSNLIQNSLKYGRSADGTAEITIALHTVGNDAVISVRDKGAGLAREDVSRVFDRFYRADPARTGVSGSGLGLTIVKQIVLRHGGKTWITTAQGGGLSVNILLPADKGDNQNGNHSAD